jgi:hypothetical protein
MPGYAGNFLARLFSLGKEVFPLLPKSILDQKSRIIEHDENLDRLVLYDFNSAKSYTTWVDYHHAWSDYDENEKHLWLAAFWRKKFLMYCIHPHEFYKFAEQIESEFDSLMLYVHLDDRHKTWVDDNKEKLKFVHRDQEQEQYEILQQRHSMQSINLSAMLDSPDQFLEEYNRCCELIGIEPHPEQALKLYENWILIRK